MKKASWEKIKEFQDECNHCNSETLNRLGIKSNFDFIKLRLKEENYLLLEDKEISKLLRVIGYK